MIQELTQAGLNLPIDLCLDTDETQPRPSIINVLDSYGLSCHTVQVSADGRLLSTTPRENYSLPEVLSQLKDIGTNSRIRTFNDETLPEQYQKLRRNGQSKYMILEEVKGRTRGRESKALGFVRFDYIENQCGPSYIDFQLFENTDEINSKSPEKFHLINNALDSIIIGEMHDAFLKIVDSEVDTTTLDYEKISIISQLRTLLLDSENILNQEDACFLRDYEEKIIQGKYDNIFQEAIRDTVVSIALTQITALTSPAIGVGVGATLGPALGALAAGATYIGAPIPSWIYMQYRNWRNTGALSSWRQMGGSFLAMNFPIVGGGAAFPMSINSQTNGELSRFRRLIHQNPTLRKELSRKEMAMDLLLHGIVNPKVNVDQEAHQETVEIDLDWEVIDRVTFNGNNDGVEIISPKTELAKHKLQQFVASEYIAHKLSSPSDENIINIGTIENPIYEMIDTSECESDWIVIRDVSSKEFVVVSKIYRRLAGKLLPMQNELLSRQQRVIYNHDNPIVSNLNIEETVGNFDYELGSLAFKLKNLKRGRNKIDNGYRMTLALLSWIRGINSYLEDNNIPEFGAVFTKKANEYLSRVGNLGIETISNPFFYIPSDRDHDIYSQIIRVNHKNAMKEMHDNNKPVYDFVVEGLVNDESVRKTIWANLIRETYRPNLTKDGLIGFASKILTKAYLLNKIASTVTL